MDLNEVTLIGNVGKDPEIKTFDNGGIVANLSMATNRKYKKKDGSYETKTEWHRIIVRDKYMVEIAQKYVMKGTQLFVRGMIETRKYQKDGTDHYIVEIIVPPYTGTLNVLTRGYESSAGNGTGEAPKEDEPFDDNIPF